MDYDNKIEELERLAQAAWDDVAVERFRTRAAMIEAGRGAGYLRATKEYLPRVQQLEQTVQQLSLRSNQQSRHRDHIDEIDTKRHQTKSHKSCECCKALDKLRTQQVDEEVP